MLYAFFWVIPRRLNYPEESKQHSEFYVHGTVHLSNTSYINTNEMQLFSLYVVFITLHVSDAVCVHRQEYYKLY